MTAAPGIDIVTRLYDLADLPHLDRLTLSVMGQAGAAPLRLHVMLQRFSFTEVQAVRQATAALRELNDGASVTLHNWDYPAPFDLRVPLLNWSLEAAPGRYFTCLDVHDQLLPHACAALLARLRATPAALALGAAVVRPAHWWGDVVLPAPGRPSEPSPVPAFMIDRQRVTPADCVFRTTPLSTEVGEFIQRLATNYAVDAEILGDTLVIRQDFVTTSDGAA